MTSKDAMAKAITWSRRWGGSEMPTYLTTKVLFTSITRLVDAHKAAEDADIEEIEMLIRDLATGIWVRSGWYKPQGDSNNGPVEYEIQFGEAIHIRGKLDCYSEPVTATLCYRQSEGHWLVYYAGGVLLDYAKHFVFTN